MDKLRSIIHRNTPLVPAVGGFNDFLERWLPSILEDNLQFRTDTGRNVYHTTVKFNRLILPEHGPESAQMNNHTYEATATVDITLYENDIEIARADNYTILRFPIMLMSDACRVREGTSELDVRIPGGVFVVRGKPKFIRCKTRRRYNTPFLMRVKTGNTENSTVEVRSLHLNKPHRSSSTLRIGVNDLYGRKNTKDSRSIYVNVPFLMTRVPLPLLLNCMGETIERFIKRIIEQGGSEDVFMCYLLRLRRHVDMPKEVALLKYGKMYPKHSAIDENIIHSANNTLTNEILPHVGKDVTDKLNYLAHCVQRLLWFDAGFLEAEDKDHFANMAVDDAGHLYAQMLRMRCREFVANRSRHLRRTALERRPEIANVYNESVLTKKVQQSVRTGKWSEKNLGISQDLNTHNVINIISQLRKIISSVYGKESRHIAPRLIHPSSYGYISSEESPEGADGCGLVHTLASTAIITREGDPSTLHRVLFEGPLKSLIVKRPVGPKVFDCNGAHVGWTARPLEVFQRVRELRRTGFIDHTIGIYRQWNGIRLDNSGGRLLRPLLIMDRYNELQAFMSQVPEPTLHRVIAAGFIEYVCAAEIQTLKVGFTPDQPGITHCEISDTALLGIAGVGLPFANHNAGARITYAVGQAKQATTGFPVERHSATKTLQLQYGQKPLVTTQAAVDFQMDREPDVINAVLAILMNKQNKEDAIIFKKEFLDRGAFHYTVTRQYTSEKKTDMDMFHRPDVIEPGEQPVTAIKYADYSAIRDTGVPAKRAKIEENGIVIGKSVEYDPGPGQSKRRKDVSIEHKGEPGTVEDVTVSDVAPFVRKVRVMSNRVPQVGDKFTSEHGQKGVIGRVVPSVDMPFSGDMIPDILIAPESFTSRMTIGMLIEMLTGKAVSLSGNTALGVDPQVYNKTVHEAHIAEVERALLAAGYASSGKETLYDGITGERMEYQVMMGPVAYRLLNHMVQDKVHARSTGPIDILTRQAKAGRSAHGGFRFGEMERNAAAGYGADAFVRERVNTLSDSAVMFVCESCGWKAEGNVQQEYLYCRMCKSPDHVRQVELPFAVILTMAELNAMGVKTTLEVDSTGT